MNLREKTIQAFVWVSSVKVISQIFSWLITILLARILSPSDYGLIGMAWIAVSFLDLLNELGIGAAIIQKQTLDDDDIHTTFWFSIFAGCVLYIVAYTVAPVFAAFFRNEALTPIIRTLSSLFIIGSLQIVPFNLLTKELDFFKRSTAEFASVVSGGILSGILAMLQYGVWSLVYGSLVRYVVLTVFLFFFYPWKPKAVFFPRKIFHLLRFGLSVASSRILIFLYSNADTIIIGKVLDEQLLGYYSMALNISNMPISKITAVVNQVTFPVFSNLQNDMYNMRLYFLSITRFVSLLTIPLMAGLFIVSDTLIQIILTDKWMPMLIPFKILCLITMIKSIDQVIPMLLYAQGKPQVVFRYTVLCFAVLPVSFFIGSHYSLPGVALAFALAYPLASVFLIHHGIQAVEISWASYLRNLLPPTMAATCMAISMLVFRYSDSQFYGKNIYFTFFGSCIIGITAYGAFLRTVYPDVVQEVYAIYASLKSRQLKQKPELSDT